MLRRCSKTFCCYDSKSQKYKFSSKGLNKRAVEDSGDGPMAKYRQVLVEAKSLKSTNRGIKRLQLLNKLEKGLRYFYPKWEVECDGINTKPLSL